MGGGQLARMMAPAATALGVELRVLAESPEVSAVAAVRTAPAGDYTDLDTLRRFAAEVDVLTFDHEHVPTAFLERLVTDGDVQVRPGPGALVHAQDKLVMRRRLTELGHPCPRWWHVRGIEDLDRALAENDGPLVVKTPRGGYDGHGVRIIERAEDAADWLEQHGELLAEQKVPFTRELSAQVARRPGGQTATYPVVQSVQRDGVCYEVVAPAPDLDEAAQHRIQRLAAAIAEDLGVTGMLAVELFETADGTVLVNELAMRPHNTGHWSMDAAVTGQFEQHLRAVADLPLGAPDLLAPCAVMVNLLGGDASELAPGARAAMEADPGIKVHLYGKSVRPGRKLGHVTVVGEDPVQLLARAHRAEKLIVDGPESPDAAGSPMGADTSNGHPSPDRPDAPEETL